MEVVADLVYCFGFRFCEIAVGVECVLDGVRSERFMKSLRILMKNGLPIIRWRNRAPWCLKCNVET